MKDIKGIKLFIENLEIRGLSTETIRSYRQDLKTFIRWLGDRPLESLDSDQIRQYLTKLHSNYQRKSIARHISTLRTLYCFLQKQGIVAKDPMAKISQIKLPQILPAVISYEEMTDLLEQPDITTLLGIRDRAIIELLYSSALRVGEAVALNLADLQGNEIWVKGKGGKERVVPVSRMAKGWIDKYLAQKDKQIGNRPLFCNCHGKRITTRSIERMIEQYVARANLPRKITPHIIRHTIATHWLERGMSIKLIQELLGHRSLATTMIYTRVSMPLKEKALRMHPLSSGINGFTEDRGDKIGVASRENSC